jgi:hypothetical protein
MAPGDPRAVRGAQDRFVLEAQVGTDPQAGGLRHDWEGVRALQLKALPRELLVSANRRAITRTQEGGLGIGASIRTARASLKLAPAEAASVVLPSPEDIRG